MGLLIKYFLITFLINLINAQANLRFEWSKWKKEFNKEYAIGRQESSDNAQEQIRFNIFRERLAKISEHNSKVASFKMGTNEFSDQTETELNERFSINIDMNTLKSNIKRSEIISNSERNLAPSVNWIENGVVTPALNQGTCGSCYTFASVTALESAHAIKYNLKLSQIRTFSQQHLLDCTYYSFYNNETKSYANLGCKGGYIYNTLSYVFRNGIQFSKDYPYTGEVGTCKYNSSRIATKLSGIYTAAHDMSDVNSIKKIVAQQPVLTHMYVASDFYDYKSGIYSSNLCSSSLTECPKGVSHAVVIVGYGATNGTEYWIVKNSWGPSFGENGFFRIALGKNMCCIEGFTYYPKI